MYFIVLVLLLKIMNVLMYTFSEKYIIITDNLYSKEKNEYLSFEG